jgi:polyvinyl alcohol dehydrogenase (cytochrome)
MTSSNHERQPGTARALLCAATLSMALPAAAADWTMAGQNARNSADQPAETAISPATASQLAPKWVYTTQGDVSARAAVVAGVVFFPDWGGWLHAVDAATGQAVWLVDLATYGLTGSSDGRYRSRTTPALANGVLYLGTQEGAWLLAIDAANGALLWKSQLESPESDPYARITSSPTIVDDLIYLGLASGEEGIAGSADYPCCKARGSVVAVHAAKGKIKWKTYTTPVGYSGAGVWGSNLAVDVDRRLVYASTGNNYSHPADGAPSSTPGVTYGQCMADGGTQASCNSPDNHVDAVLALEARTGAVRWSRHLVTWQQDGVMDGGDDWNVGCLFPPFLNCPSGAGPDYDFASAPQLITYTNRKGVARTIVGAGQKSGIYYALDPKTGATVWQTQAGPGSSMGGMQWGSASDGKRIYVQVTNFDRQPTPLGSDAGYWAALDPASGAVLWRAADPNGSFAMGAVTAANGVVFVPSMSANSPADPTMLALDAATGQGLWSFAAGASVVAGATVVDGVVYWGSGYGRLWGFTGGNRFYAFSLDAGAATREGQRRKPD